MYRVNRVALGIVIIGLFLGALLPLVGPRKWDGWGWNPMVGRGIVVFLASCAMAVLLMLGALLFSLMGAQWSKNRPGMRMLVYLECGLIVAAMVLAIGKLLLDSP